MHVIGCRRFLGSSALLLSLPRLKAAICICKIHFRPNADHVSPSKVTIDAVDDLVTAQLTVLFSPQSRQCRHHLHD